MNKKSAFSLTEVLVVLTFIGFIIVTQLVVMTSKVNQYSGPYFTVYNAVKKTAYNVLADIYCPCTGNDCPNEECKKGPREYPKTSTNLCKRFSEFINTSENNCNNFKPVGNDLDFKKATPGFIATNSYKFYFHDGRFTKTINGKTVNFAIIYVDINGEKRPNRFVCDNSDILPDIVPFAITDNGDAIPIGLPTYSKAYMTASVGYPSKNSMEKVNSLIFNDAILTAWPNDTKGNISIPFSVNYVNELNSAIQNKFVSCVSDNSPTQKVKYVPQIATNLGCKKDTYNCRVIIDKHKTTRF